MLPDLIYRHRFPPATPQRGWGQGKLLDTAEEDYFNADDDEDDEIRDGNADVYDPNDTGKGDDINESDEEADEAKVASSLAMPEEDPRVAKACTDANKRRNADRLGGA